MSVVDRWIGEGTTGGGGEGIGRQPASQSHTHGVHPIPPRKRKRTRRLEAQRRPCFAWGSRLCRRGRRGAGAKRDCAAACEWCWCWCWWWCCCPCSGSGVGECPRGASIYWVPWDGCSCGLRLRLPVCGGGRALVVPSRPTDDRDPQQRASERVGGGVGPPVCWPACGCVEAGVQMRRRSGLHMGLCSVGLAAASAHTHDPERIGSVWALAR